MSPASHMMTAFSGNARTTSSDQNMRVTWFLHCWQSLAVFLLLSTLNLCFVDLLRMSYVEVISGLPLVPLPSSSGTQFMATFAGPSSDCLTAWVGNLNLRVFTTLDTDCSPDLCINSSLLTWSHIPNIFQYIAGRTHPSSNKSFSPATV